MQIIVDIPDEFVQALFPAGQDPARATLEAIAIEGSRAPVDGISTAALKPPGRKHAPVHG